MKRWYKYVKPYLSSFILGPLGMIVEVIGEMFMPLLLAELINSANDGVLTVGKSIWLALGLIVIVLLMMSGGVAGAYFGSKASVNFAADLRRDMYAKVQAVYYIEPRISNQKANRIFFLDKHKKIR